MTGFTKSGAPSTWGAERGKLDGNWDIADSMKRVFMSQNDASQFSGVPVGQVEVIDWGTPSVEETAYLTYAAGVITFVTPGIYVAAIKLQLGRSSASGVADVATRTVFTPSGGSAMPGAPRFTEQENANSSAGLTRFNMVNVAAGDAFFNEFVKDAGNATVALEAVPLATPGWGTSPSASLEVWKMHENGTSGFMDL